MEEDEEQYEVHRVTAPCLLPEEGRLVSLRVVGDRYWPVCIEPHSSQAKRSAAQNGNGTVGGDGGGEVDPGRVTQVGPILTPGRPDADPRLPSA